MVLSAFFPFALEPARRKKHCYSAPFRVLKLPHLYAQKKEKSGNNSATGVVRHKPAGKLLRQIRGKIHSKLSARIQPQRIAVVAIKEQLDRMTSG